MSTNQYSPAALCAIINAGRIKRPLTHAGALEVIAQLEGARNWNLVADRPDVAVLKIKAKLFRQWLNAKAYAGPLPEDGAAKIIQEIHGLTSTLAESLCVPGTVRQPAPNWGTAGDHPVSFCGLPLSVDELHSNTLFTGNPGSGKTVAGVRPALQALYAGETRGEIGLSGGLILDASSGLVPAVKALANQLGSKVTVLEVGTPVVRFNLIDPQASAQEAARDFCESVFLQSEVVEPDDYRLHYAIGIVRAIITSLRIRHPGVAVTVMDILQFFMADAEFIATLGKAPDSALRAACAPLRQYQADLDESIATRTRDQMILALTPILKDGNMREQFCTTDSIDLQRCPDRGAFVVMTCPRTHREIGNLVGRMLKQRFQAMTFKRMFSGGINASMSSVLFVAEEAERFSGSSRDRHWLSRTRFLRVVTLLSAQSEEDLVALVAPAADSPLAAFGNRVRFCNHNREEGDAAQWDCGIEGLQHIFPAAEIGRLKPLESVACSFLNGKRRTHRQQNIPQLA